MKNLKKILAVVLVVMMTAALSAAIFAEPAALNDKGIVGDDSGAALDKSVVIYKEMTAYNPNGSTVNAPNITYNYVITAGAADAVITDKDGVVVTTKAGVGNPSITSSVAWTSAETVETAADGAHNQKPITIDFSGVTFDAAGVYRYVITESLAEGFTYATSGVTDGTITATRYLDVYVRDAQTGETGRQIYGYVLFAEIADPHTANSTTDSDVTAAEKTTGFVPDVGPDGTTQQSADSYYTYDVTITKTLTGDNAMNDHQFPFTVQFENGTITKNIDIIGTAAGTATAADVADGAITDVTVNPKIANGGSAVYTGIPVGTKVTVYETNDVTGATYKSSAVVTTAETGDTAAAEKNIAPTQSSNSAIVDSTAANTAASGNKTVAFTNVYELISPTGVIVRIAPFALILLAGVVLFVLVRRRKVED